MLLAAKPQVDIFLTYHISSFLPCFPLRFEQKWSDRPDAPNAGMEPMRAASATWMVVGVDMMRVWLKGVFQKSWNFGRECAVLRRRVCENMTQTNLAREIWIVRPKTSGYTDARHRWDAHDMLPSFIVCPNTRPLEDVLLFLSNAHRKLIDLLTGFASLLPPFPDVTMRSSGRWRDLKASSTAMAPSCCTVFSLTFIQQAKQYFFYHALKLCKTYTSRSTIFVIRILFLSCTESGEICHQDTHRRRPIQQAKQYLFYHALKLCKTYTSLNPAW